MKFLTAKPIPFRGPMVRAIREGKKTQTRRVLKLPRGVGADDVEFVRMQPGYEDGTTRAVFECGDEPFSVRCPFGKIGDKLWVREDYGLHGVDDLEAADLTNIVYRADDPDWKGNTSGRRWRPGLFMPRWASRFLLELTDVRVERVDSISEADAAAEGFAAGRVAGSEMAERNLGGGLVVSSPGLYASAAGAFQLYWIQMHGQDAYDLDPWVWALSFKRLATAAPPA